MSRWQLAAAALALAGALQAGEAKAQVKVGVTVSITGPGASLGIAEKNVFDLLPREIAGQTIEYIILDDGTDPNAAVQNARRLMEENKVDILMGSTTSPNCLAIVPAAASGTTPLIAMAASASIVEPVDEVRRWVFKTEHNDAMMMETVVQHMVKHGVKQLGYIGLADATGDGFLKALKARTEPAGISMVAIETYNRTDQSVLAQVLRLLGTKTDAIFVSSFGTPAATPQLELSKRGYKGKVHHTHGAANADFLRVAGASAEGVYLPMSPFLIASQLPDNHPSKAISLDVTKRYEAKFGPGSVSTFVGNSYDAYLLFANALPKALKSGAKPGTPQVRAALRDAIEATRDLAASRGVYTMSATDHVGLDERSRYIIQVVKGQWTLAD
jgi:branched-chain amino acid transport system substrate-binding protein